MERNASITELYSKVTEAFLRNIEEKDKEAASKAYLEYLHSSYDSLFSSSPEENFNSVASVCVRKEKMIHIDLNAESKMAFLFPDKAFLSLQEMSFEIAELAQAKKTGAEYSLSKTKQEYLDELNAYADKVSPSFKYSSERILSEALMDLSFLFDDDSIQSFRTSIL